MFEWFHPYLARGEHVVWKDTRGKANGHWTLEVACRTVDVHPALSSLYQGLPLLPQDWIYVAILILSFQLVFWQAISMKISKCPC